MKATALELIDSADALPTANMAFVDWLDVLCQGRYSAPALQDRIFKGHYCVAWVENRVFHGIFRADICQDKLLDRDDPRGVFEWLKAEGTRNDDQK
jgi:uncharacterized protein (DUF2126 family)